MKRAPSIPAPSIELLAPRREPLFDLEISVITPLFGGGAEPGVADPLVPVRASSIRGHLRFWWRACKGASFETADDLFAAEEEIWGSVDNPSPLAISVQTLSGGTPVPPSEYKSFRDGRFPAYALFPYQQAAEATTVALEGVRFLLHVTLGNIAPIENKRTQVSKPGLTGDAIKAHVEAALWAWLTFGGIGARTRRGCGSLFCSNDRSSSQNDDRFVPTSPLEEWLQKKAQEHIANNARMLSIPLLQGARCIIGTAAATSEESWKVAVNRMRAFRQGLDLGRDSVEEWDDRKNRFVKRPKRSRWPEADSIRDLTGLHSRGHDPEHAARPYYPRADLGLPIVFHYKNQGDPVGRNRDTGPTLQAADDDATRMASPIILKPLAISKEKAVPLVLCLDAPHVWDMGIPALEIRSYRSYRIPVDQVKNAVSKNANVPPLNRFGAVPARDAFMAYAERQPKSSIITLSGKER